MGEVTDLSSKIRARRRPAGLDRERMIDEIVAHWDAMEAAWWQAHGHHLSGNSELARAAMLRADAAKAAFYQARQQLHEADESLYS